MMIAIGRGLLLALLVVAGLLVGSGGLFAFGLWVVTSPPLPPAAAAQDWAITLDLTDGYLAEQIDAGSVGSQYTLRDVRVTSRDDGTVMVNAIVTAALGGSATPGSGRLGLPFPLPNNPPAGTSPTVPGEFVLRPGARDGKLVVDVERASLGPLPLPSNLGQLLENPLNRQVASTMQDRPFRIVDVMTRQGVVSIRAARDVR